jgi:hypothetical protein
MAAAVLVGLMAGAESAAAATGNGMIAANGIVMRADGSGVVPLFEPAAAFVHPKFSPDGNSVLFNDWPAVQPQPSLKTASLVRNDGVRQAAGVGAGDAAWSPDSQRIVYAKYIDVPGGTDRVEIHTVSPDGSGDALLITESYSCVYPGWAGGIFWNQVTDRIMYVCGNGTDLLVTSIKPDGTDRQSHGAIPESPSTEDGYFNHIDLSPDGTKFAGTWSDEISAWDWHGGTPTKITTDGLWTDTCCSETWASWAPDGTKLVYADDRAPWGLSIVSASGGPETPIGLAGEEPTVDDWQPCVTGVTVTCEPITLKSTPVRAPADGGGGGDDATTPVPTPAPTPTPASPGPGPFDNAPRFKRGAAKQDGANGIAVKVGCDARSVVPCAVTVEVSTVKAVAAAKKRKLIVGRRSVTVAPGATKKVRIKLSSKARKVLKRKRKLALNVLATARRSDGQKVTARTKVTIRAKKKR